MCRNIKTLFNFEPPATDDEVRDAALQFVRKLSGTTQAVEAQRGGVRPRRRPDRGGRPRTAGLDGNVAATREPRRGSRQGARQDGDPACGPLAQGMALVVRSDVPGCRMSFFPARDPEPGDAFACDAIELMVIANAKDIGGFEVRRALPTAKRRLVGPFIFFDRMGPAILRAGQALDVRPHPHIGLVDRHLSVRRQDQASRFARHRNGDRAGRREPDDGRPRHRPFRAHAGGAARRARCRFPGLQTWLALPDGKEEVDPLFETHRAARHCP